MNVIGNIGFSEMILILLLALLVFGPERLPELSRKAGALVRDLRRVYTNLSKDLGPELASLPTAIQEVRDTAEALKSLPRDAIRSLSQAAALDESLGPIVPAAGAPRAASDAVGSAGAQSPPGGQEDREMPAPTMRPTGNGDVPGAGQIDPRTAPVQETAVVAAELRAEGPSV